MNNNIGKQIKDLRIKKGVSLLELTEKSGMNISKISKIENNHQILTVKDLEILASALDVSAATLLRGEKMRIIPSRDDSLVDKIKEAGKLYAIKQKGEFAGCEVGRIITKEIPMSLITKSNINQDKFLVVGSIGKGQYAEIPWISIFNKRITKSATKGIYIVYLYTSDMKGIYLSLNQGYTYFREKFGGRRAKDEIKKMSDTLRELVFIPENMRNFNIDLKANKLLGKGYMAGHIAGKYYDLENMPKKDILILDLLELIEVYDEINVQIRNRTVEQFYDYIVATKQGMIDSELEVSSTQINVDEDKDSELGEIDIPKDKQESVIDYRGNKKYLRNPKEAIKALKLVQFKCEIDGRHETFIAKVTGKQYMESHHLIPISKSDLFGYSIDIPANICSLCPNCHRAIHSASSEVKNKMLVQLYEQRKDRLEKSGIYITIEQLIKFYE